MRKKATTTTISRTKSPITIDRVSYRQTFNTGNYTSETIEFSANCNGEPHLKVLDFLRRSVFFASKASKLLWAEALDIMNSDHVQSPTKLRWAEAVLEKRETRLFSESKKDYES